MNHSLLSIVLSAAAARIANDKPLDVIDDTQLVETLQRLSNLNTTLDFTAVKQTDTIEKLLAEAIRFGCEAALDWWTGADLATPYHDVMQDTLLAPRLVADVVPELYTRYLLLENKTS